MTKIWMCFLCVFSSIFHHAYAQQSVGRLLVSIDAQAAFSPMEFAQASSAKLIVIDPRNPFMAFPQLLLDTPFVVLSEPLQEKLLNTLACDNGYRYKIFKTETLEAAVKRAHELLQTIPQKSSEIPALSQEISQQIYTLMAKIDQVFTKHNITYWAGGGTLLGAVRHKGLAPWDDDLDLYILDSDVAKLADATPDLEAVGLYVHSYFKDIYKIYAQDALPIEDLRNPGQVLPFGYPAADLFTVALHRRHEKDDVYTLKSRTYYWEWDTDQFAYAQIQAICRVPFGPLMLPIPGNPELTLNRLYGTPEYPNLWQTHALEPTWDHSREWTIRGQKGAALVEIDDFSPAPWN